ncbi:class F sortase [Priestia filamentosa]|nr:class F sortase [Priestia filamentosa]MDT3761889.1 class F sortase [Priestia filamentosa]OXS67975.1 hypothetical protein B1B01_15490 [Priestia filamentosa]RJS64824.1 class F sortase [Priestia filamentosa]WCM16978.1 class F sortase [Priestia filamentosa]WRU96395.1 class F sortase [Priestia filamentosa]
MRIFPPSPSPMKHFFLGCIFLVFLFFNSPYTLAAHHDQPVLLLIPTANIVAPIEAHGLSQNGEIILPENSSSVTWFQNSSSPGERGNAVIAGHVDSKKGRAIFYSLSKMRKGDTFFIQKKSGKTMSFTVTKTAVYERNQFPVNKVFGSSSKRTVHLVTCTGLFNKEEGTHADRLLVTATLNPFSH